MASRSYLYSTSNLTAGKPVASEDDVNSLCLKFTPVSPMALITGYGSSNTSGVVLNCTSKRVGSQDCEVMDYDETENKTKSNQFFHFLLHASYVID